MAECVHGLALCPTCRTRPGWEPPPDPDPSPDQCPTPEADCG